MLVFIVLFFIPGFVVSRAFDGQPMAQICGQIAIAILATAAAVSSYRATMKRAKKRTAPGGLS